MKSKNRLFQLVGFIGLILMTHNVFSQKTIVQQSGEEIQVKNYKLVMNPHNSLKYRPAAYASGPYHYISLDEVKYIKSKRNKGLAFHRKGTIFKIKNVSYLNEVQLQGAIDACKYYGFGGPQAATFITSFLAMPVGLVTSIGVSSIRPTQNLNMPMNDLSQSIEYRNAYEKQAHQVKKQAAWAGFATGWTTAISLGIIISSLAAL